MKRYKLYINTTGAYPKYILEDTKFNKRHTAIMKNGELISKHLIDLRLITAYLEDRLA